MDEIKHMFISYIESQECFCDSRNREVYDIENSMLQKTIHVKAFHKEQIGQLIITKIIKNDISEKLLEAAELVREENKFPNMSVKDSNSSFFNNCQSENQVSETSEIIQTEFDLQSLSSSYDVRPIQVKLTLYTIETYEHSSCADKFFSPLKAKHFVIFFIGLKWLYCMTSKM